MGEAKMKRENALAKLIPCSSLQTAGGRVQVRWESESAATPMGQLAYFIEFLTLTGLWQRWKESYEYALLVTNLDHDILALGQLYRDRADAGNAFDELKNQWGWGGLVCAHLKRVLAGIAPPKTRRSLEQLAFAEWLTAVFRMKQPWPH